MEVPATEKQLRFIRSLLEQVPEEVKATAEDWLNKNWTNFDGEIGDRLDKGTASSVIQRLLDQKEKADEAKKREERAKSLGVKQEDLRVYEIPDAGKKPPERYIKAGDYLDIPEGRYAITEDNITKFYHVQRGKKSKRPGGKDWSGKLFVKSHIAGRDDINIGKVRGEEVLAQIREDGPEKASARYGHELGHCGVCNRELTNEESRRLGIGPVCRAKVGWASSVPQSESLQPGIEVKS